MTARHALVLGGTGAVGGAVLAELRRRGLTATFTYHRSRERAAALAAELDHRAVAVDLREPGAIAAMLDGLDRDGVAPDVLIGCAAVSPGGDLAGQTDAEWRACFAVNVDATAQVCRWFARGERTGDIVLVGGLDRGQSLPLPVAYAASQGALSAMVMALGHELGGRIRVNLVALGVLDRGLSQQLSTARRKDYRQFSALRREGTPEEAARVIVWFALENTYVQGKVIAANGGI